MQTAEAATRDHSNSSQQIAEAAEKVKHFQEKFRQVDVEKRGMSSDFLRYQRELETLKASVDHLTAELRTVNEKWETAEKDTLEVTVQRDKNQRELDRQIKRVEMLDESLANVQNGNADVASLMSKLQSLSSEMDAKDSEIETLKAELQMEKLLQDTFSAKYEHYKTLADETEQERYARQTRAAVKMQAVQRGKMGRRRAGFVQVAGGPEQLEVVDKLASQQRLEAGLAEEQAMAQRASNREVKRKSDHRCWQRLNRLVNALLVPDNVDDLMQRIIEVKASAWAKRMFG